MPRKKINRNNKTKLFSHWTASKKIAVLFIAIFAVFGAYSIYKSLAAVSTGAVEVNTCTNISGWAYDKDKPATSTSVDIYITEQASPQVGRDFGVRITTTTTRADVNKAYGITGNHGFSYGVPANFKNNIKYNTFVFALGVDASGNLTGENPLIGSGSWKCAPDTSSKPMGAVDVANCTTVSGWALDKDVSGSSISVHIYIGGPAGSGQFGAVVDANISRPDVNSTYGAANNHGFKYGVPAKFRDGKYYPIYIYAIGANSVGVPDGDNPLIAQKSCGTPPPPPPATTAPATTTSSGLLAGLQAIAGCTSHVLRQGSSGGCVTILQTALNNLIGAGLATDGQFGPATNNAVRKYQAGNGLSVDGVVGPQTWGAITSGKRGSATQTSGGSGGGGGGGSGGGGSTGNVTAPQLQLPPGFNLNIGDGFMPGAGGPSTNIVPRYLARPGNNGNNIRNTLTSPDFWAPKRPPNLIWELLR